ncbi:MAG TPA: response regulator, partial [Gemmataceae bacterium]|nr:response regulator [Gemmataceae bacterium]
IEDNEGDTRLIQEMLRDGGGGRFRLECADRLTVGLDRLTRDGIDVVLLDLSLPESKGLGSLLRVHENAPAVPVVVLTGSQDEELGNRAVQSGAQDYLIKGHVDGALLARSLRYAIERGGIEEELRRRVEQLAELDRRKDEFLATLAHELRNPLAPIRNALHILRLSGGSGPAAERVREMIERQVNQLVRLVDDLMEVSRITRGKIELRKERVELAAVLRSAVETSRPLIEAGGHQLAIALPADPVILDADPMRLSQVVANLLNNAAKYTEEGGQIWLTARRDGRDAVVSVRDTGVGIPTDMLPRVFDMFAQVDRTLQRSQGGLGIGLTLARILVEMHGGRVEARSGGLGRGSEFILRLPTAPTSPLGREGGAAVSGQQSGPLGQLRVLVVDDNHDAADSFAMLLRFLGAEAHVVYDGPSALAALPSYRPSVVFLDIGMAGMDGHEVARRVRQTADFREVTLIAMTGWGQEEDRRRSKAAGFDHHLVKPVDARILQSLLAAQRKPAKSASN